ncbi:ABC transporter ATP-binding protein [Bacillus clarus]|uniref:ABC transporter ATP-binding protein n=1 Tax=Bacillus clarus TaxID=2338372 RepID=A0A090Y9M3_9BACI|nr:ABC transporter ATP-binding protein [Bacillus clarus]KFM95159.1 ABC transporter family protein [Bacillus clarus]RFT63440.1 ABC transporter ATP-binding protein [Bacillus clarus]
MLLQVNNVKKAYKKSEDVLKNISFHMDSYERIAIIGRNGIGKSTLLKIVSGLLIPNEGEILFQKQDLLKNPTCRKDIGFVFTEPIFYESLTVEENLIFLASLYKVNSIKHTVTKKMEIFNIYDYRQKKISALSSGMKQKVQICAATIHNPKLLIMDEPFNKLDSLSLEFLYEFILNFEGGILFTSHDKEHVYNLSTKILVLKDGEISHGMEYPKEVISHTDFYKWYDEIL